MNIQNLFKIARRTLLLNKTRAMLTMLGIIIGVGSVITMLAIGEGSGVNTEYLSIRKWSVAEGSIFGEDEITNFANR
jgi:macrolide export ATP-binding/permease protein macB